MRRRSSGVAQPAGVGRVVVATVSSTVIASLPVFLLGGLAVLVQEDLSFGPVGLGLAVTTFFAVAAVASVPAGRTAARFGSARTMALAGGLSAAALVAMASAPSYPALLIALGLAGAANATAQISSNQALAQLVPPKRQGFAFGIKQSAVPASTLLAGLALPLLGVTVGWRATMLVAAVLALVLLVSARLPPTAAPVAGDRPRASSSRGRVLALLAVAAALGAGAANSLGAFLVASTVALDWTPASAGLLLSFGSAVGVVMRLTIGWLADRRDGGHLLAVAGMLASGAVALGLLATGSTRLLPVATALAFGLGWSWPGLLTYAVVRLDPDAPAAATGITQSGVFVGGAVGPLAFGVIVHGTSYQVAWSLAAGALVAAALLVCLARRVVGLPKPAGAERG